MMQVGVIGAGGHGRELASIIRSHHGSNAAIQFWDDNIKPGQYDFGEVRGLVSEIADSGTSHFAIGIGDPASRAAIALRYELADLEPLTAVHPSSQIGDRSVLGAGVIMGPGSVITCDTTIGEHTHIHSGVVIAHDCEIGDFVVVTPGVSVAGDVRVNELAWLGVGSTINRGISIGRGAVVGAGAVVINDVENNDTVAGVPARSLDPGRQR